jgi:hypothetical protein
MTTTIVQGVGGGRMCPGGGRQDLTAMSPPPRGGGGGWMSERRANLIVILVPPIAQEEVDSNANRLRAIVDKTGQQKSMKVGGTGRKGKGRRGLNFIQ